MINDKHLFFYDIETSEFDFYTDPIYSGIEDDYKKFYDDCEITIPSHVRRGYDLSRQRRRIRDDFALWRGLI